MSQQRWVPYVALSGTTLVGGMTVLVSGTWLTNLAGLVGMHGLMAVSLPITIDAGGAVGTMVWLTGPSKDARTWGRAVAVGALAASITGNVLAHLIGGAAATGPVWLVVGVSAVYPLQCWLMVHLMVLLRTPARPTVKKPAGKKSTSRATVAPAKPTPAAPTPAAAPTGPVALHAVDSPVLSKKAQARDWFHTQVAAGRDPVEIKPSEVDKAIGASGYAKKFIAEWRIEATADVAAEAAQ